MMKRTVTDILVFVAFTAVLCSCVHQFPTAEPADVRITLTFDSEMDYYKTVVFPDETRSLNEESSADMFFGRDFSGHEDYDVRYIIEAYPISESGTYGKSAVARWVFTEDDASVMDDYTVTISLDEGRYQFRAWADFVKPGSLEDYYYVTDDWTDGIRINMAQAYTGNSDWRDAYTGRSDLEVIRYGAIAAPASTTIDMYRPMGKFVFVTNDLDDFVTKMTRAKATEFDMEDYSLVIAYTGFLPSSYSMNSDRANDSEVNMSFSSKLRQIDETRALMGFDYVFANPSTMTQTKVLMGVELRDREGAVLASHISVAVPIIRSGYTVVEGRFLMQESSGGIVLNPDFDGEFVVPVY